MQQAHISRRALLGGAASLLARPAAARPKLKVAIFSKHLQFVQGPELAEAAADLGFDAVDITVRKGGHVAPERVARELPPLVAEIRKRRLDVPMITTDIADAETPFAEDILRTASDLDIRHYRFGAFRYTADRPYTAQLEAFRPRLAALARLNEKYKMCAMYHTHSGVGLVGASIWDLHMIMRDLDPARIGVNFDVAHATVEGGLGGWINSFHITGPHLRGIAAKDFVWAKDAHPPQPTKSGLAGGPGGKWDARWVPLGEGMVRWPQFWEMVAQSDFNGPLQVHFEYELGPSREATYSAMRRDLATLRGQLTKAGL